MSDLLTVTEFIALRSISKKVNTEKVQESIDLSEQSDLYQFLGDFFFDLLKNFGEVSYSDLMAGSEFTYCDEVFIHKGIKALLADLTYARYIYMINVNLTPFGAQTKFTDDSEAISRNTIKDISTQAKVDANTKFKIIQKYLLSDPVIFKRYCDSQNVSTGFNSQKFSKL